MLHGPDLSKDYDLNDVLRTITLLGVLLYKLDRNKEVYMKETAFKLGQLLAAADIVHAGYCADVRKGDVPPALLGNQIFTIAQTAPVKALSMLGRRWKPYAGWAKKAMRDTKWAEELINSGKNKDVQRGWDIKKALRYAREMGSLAPTIAQSLNDCRVDDVFRAELLLGYMAGFPNVQKEHGAVSDERTSNKQED
jgi:hypothetical protein